MPEKIKVLMVDDEEQFRTTTSKILSRRGYETTVAGNGEEALEILEQSHHDVVILDIKMPGIDGHEALARIKKINPAVQVIMLTGHGGLESAKQSLRHGAFDYLKKPCEIDLLDSKIKDAYGVVQKGVKVEKKAGDIMIPVEDYTTIDADRTIKEGIEALKRSYESPVSTSRIMETGHRSILVFDKKGALAGILSILDLVRAIQPSYLSAPKPSMADIRYILPCFGPGFLRVRQRDWLIKR